MTDLSRAVAVGFPLRGEWRAFNSPADGSPGHGTDYLGQRYAVDFARMDPTGIWYYPGELRTLARHMTLGLPASAFFCWDAPVVAASAGRVLVAADGWPDRRRVQFGWELVRASVAPPRVRPPRAGMQADIRPLAGNHVLIEGPEGVAVYAHLALGSVVVRSGERVAMGQPLARIGNSGNSTMPHLHFHLMDGPDPLAARGVPCAFTGYERWVGDTSIGHWEPVEHGVPKNLERVRAA